MSTAALLCATSDAYSYTPRQTVDDFRSDRKKESARERNTCRSRSYTLQSATLPSYYRGRGKVRWVKVTRARERQKERTSNTPTRPTRSKQAHIVHVNTSIYIFISLFSWSTSVVGTSASYAFLRASSRSSCVPLGLKTVNVSASTLRTESVTYEAPFPPETFLSSL